MGSVVFILSCSHLSQQLVFPKTLHPISIDAFSLFCETEPIESVGVISVPVKTFAVKSVPVVPFLVVFVIVKSVIDHSVEKTHIALLSKNKATLNHQNGRQACKGNIVTRSRGATG